MHLTPQTRIGDVVLELPEAMRLFEKRDLDYCCGGHRSLQQVCAQAGLDPIAVIGELETLQRTPQAAGEPKAWVEAPLADLIAHIEARHHTFTRDELNRVAPLMEKVLRVHGDHHPELARISACFQALQRDLMPHLQNEEQILFPYIRGLEGEEGREAGFHTVQGPISVLQSEHEQAGVLLREIKELTHQHTPPDDACGSYKSLYMGLKALEEDLHLHIYLESHLLFPRALVLEAESLGLARNGRA